MRLPALLPRPFLDAVASRVAVLWLIGRTGLAFVTAREPPPEVILALSLTSAVVLVVWISMRRSSELLFLANLGYSFRGIAVWIAVECVALETLWGAIVA
jgi:hypothetical protein